MALPTTALPRFRFNSYWGTWNLVLTTKWAVVSANGRRPSHHSTVEISLQPVNGWGYTAEDDGRIRALNLRVHSTAAGKNDTLAHELPDHVEKDLIAHLGSDLAAWLLDPTTEILGLVDWNVYAVHRPERLAAIGHGPGADRPPSSPPRSRPPQANTSCLFGLNRFHVFAPFVPWHRRFPSAGIRHRHSGLRTSPTHLFLSRSAIVFIGLDLEVGALRHRR